MHTRTLAGVVSLAVVAHALAGGDPRNDRLLATPAHMGKEAGTPLEAVIDHLRSNSGQPVFVHWPMVEAAGIRRGVPVTVDLTGLTLGGAAAKLATQFEGPALAFTADEGVLTISVPSDLRRKVETRCYDVRTLLAPDDAGRPQRVEALLRRVQGVNPLAWKGNRDAFGNVQEIGGQLIVTQTPEMQRRVALELGDGRPAAEQARLLQTAEARPPAPKAAPAAVPATPMAKTRAELERQVPEIRFDGVKLGDALDFVRDTTGAKVDVEWGRLAKAKLTPERKVDVRLRTVRVDKVLTTLLAAAANGAPDDDDAPSFSVRPNGDVLVTSRRDQFARFGEARNFPIGDLVAPGADGDAVRGQLRTMITGTIAVRSWATRPGAVGGTASIDGDTLRVTQTPDVQEQIEGRLKSLRG